MNGGPQLVHGPAWPGVRVLATTRLGGVSAAPYDSLNLGAHVGDEPQAVAANRARVAALLPREPLWLDQVHGTEVFDADAAVSAELIAPPRADAAVTREPGRVLAVMTADCLPVVIAADGVLAVAHAGWRGLAAGVLENAVAAMRVNRGAELRAWIGPAIGQSAFEVGDEVRAAFAERHALPEGIFVLNGASDAQGRPKWQADLAGLAALRLRASGVQTIVQSGICTVEENDCFYSYRKEGRTGRSATIAWLEY
jgi:hypothetical protein